MIKQMLHFWKTRKLPKWHTNNYDNFSLRNNFFKSYKILQGNEGM